MTRHTRSSRREDPRDASPPEPPPSPAGMALTELLAALEGERRTHAAATRAGQRKEPPPMREQSRLDGALAIEHDRTEAHAAELRARARRERDERAAGIADDVVMGEAAPGVSFTLTPGHPAPRFPAVTQLDQELEALERFEVDAAIRHLQALVYSSAVAAGWHDPKVIEGVMREPSAAERVALIHEECTELLQHARDGRPAGGSVWTPAVGTSNEPKPDSAGFELADIVIRCLDYAGRYEIPLGELIIEKMRYNRTRAHRHGGRLL